MKTSLHQILVALQCIALPLCVAALGTLSSGCNGREVSTNIGNRPHVEPGKFEIRLSGSGVRVVGLVGAVTPGGGMVTVVNLTTSVEAHGLVAANGSFAVVVPGTLQDEYRVVVTANDMLESFDLTAPNRDGGAVSNLIFYEGFQCLEDIGAEGGTSGNVRGPQPLCGKLHAEAKCRMREQAAAQDLRCVSDLDCLGEEFWTCADCFVVSGLSTSGAEELEAQQADLAATLCAEFAAQGCSEIPSGCPARTRPRYLCSSGECRGFECQGIDGDNRCRPSALSRSGYCGDGGTECITLASLSQGCIGSHTEQTCTLYNQSFTKVGGDDAADLYFDPDGVLHAVHRLEDVRNCPDWYGLNLSGCVPTGEPITVSCE